VFCFQGLGGGEKALPSSFALSAAAFGRTSKVQFLQNSKGGTKDKPSCNWLTSASFA
jgi:hypothetical protein